MWSNFLSPVVEDIKLIIQKSGLVTVLITPFLLIILLRFLFPLFLIKNEFLHYKYYTLISITLLSVIPMVFGVVFGKQQLNRNSKKFVIANEYYSNVSEISANIRILTILVLSFLFIYISILILKPVPSQGWIRSIYVAVLLSIQAPLGFLFTGIKGYKKVTGSALSLIYWIFVIMLPVGLLLHHPWNYVALVSPFYWIAWAWMVQSAGLSLLYGFIALAFTSIAAIIPIRQFF